MTITLTRSQWLTVHQILSADTVEWKKYKRVPRAQTALGEIVRQCREATGDEISVDLPLARVWTWAESMPAEIRAVIQAAMDIERVHLAFGGEA